MIIKNNYNKKDMNPLDNYTKIGKGSHNIENELEKERQGFIRMNMNDPVLQKLRGLDEEKPDDRDEDKWDFFR